MGVLVDQGADLIGVTVDASADLPRLMTGDIYQPRGTET